MADLIDFLHAALFDGGLRGRFVAQIKNPQNTDGDVSQWLQTGGYTVPPADVARLRNINTDHESVNGPLAPLPKY